MLLIAMLMVMMMAGLATFAAHNANTGTVAVRNVRQFLRLQRANEAFLDAVAAYLEAVPAETPADIRWTDPVSDADSVRSNYGLPEYGGETLFQLKHTDLPGGLFVAEVLPVDSALSVGAVTPFTFQAEALLERFPVSAPAGQGAGTVNGVQAGQQRYRVGATAYTHMLFADDSARTGDGRGRNELIGISRAYFDVVR